MILTPGIRDENKLPSSTDPARWVEHQNLVSLLMCRLKTGAWTLSVQWALHLNMHNAGDALWYRSNKEMYFIKLSFLHFRPCSQNAHLALIGNAFVNGNARHLDMRLRVVCTNTVIRL